MEGRGVRQLPRRRRPRPRGSAALRIPPPGREGAAPGGARPQVPSSRSLPGAAPAAVTAACGKLGAGAPSRARAGRAGLHARARPPPLPVSPAAGGAWRGGRGVRTAMSGSPGARAHGAGMSGSRCWGDPVPEHGGAFRIAMWRSPIRGAEASAPMLGTPRTGVLRARRRVRTAMLGSPGAPAWRTEGSGPRCWEPEPGGRENQDREAGKLLCGSRGHGPRGVLWAFLGRPPQGGGEQNPEGSAGERKPEAGGAGGGARETGAPERVEWGEAGGFSGEGWRGLRGGGRGTGSRAESRRAAGCVMEDRGLEGWNAAAGDPRWLGWWWGLGDHLGQGNAAPSVE